jgi:hypothetical protein
VHHQTLIGKPPQKQRSEKLAANSGARCTEAQMDQENCGPLPFCPQHCRTHSLCTKQTVAAKTHEEPMQNPEKHKAAEVSHRRLSAF